MASAHPIDSGLKRNENHLYGGSRQEDRCFLPNRYLDKQQQFAVEFGKFGEPEGLSPAARSEMTLVAGLLQLIPSSDVPMPSLRTRRKLSTVKPLG